MWPHHSACIYAQTRWARVINQRTYHVCSQTDTITNIFALISSNHAPIYLPCYRHRCSLWRLIIMQQSHTNSCLTCVLQQRLCGCQKAWHPCHQEQTISCYLVEMSSFLTTPTFWHIQWRQQFWGPADSLRQVVIGGVKQTDKTGLYFGRR